MYSYEIKSNRPTLASSLREPIANGMTTSSSLFGYLMRNAIRGSQWHPVRVSDEECNQRLSGTQGARVPDERRNQRPINVQLACHHSPIRERPTDKSAARRVAVGARRASEGARKLACPRANHGQTTGKPRANHGQSAGNQRAISTRRLACPQATGTVPSRGNLARSPGFGPRT